MAKAKITADMSIGEVVKKWPQTAEALLKSGLPCVGCPVAMSETLEQGAAAHGIKIKELLNDLNKVIAKRKNE